jgi:hypothetical protein
VIKVMGLSEFLRVEEPATSHLADSELTHESK